jgi:hypothetical protein
MPNPRAEAIQRLYKKPFDYANAFDRALKKHPTTQTFVIVATKDPDIFSFVPKHLERFTTNTTRLGTIERPKVGKKSRMALIEKVVDMLGTLEPKYQMESLIYSILNYKIRERITETFYSISLVMRGAIAANAPYKDQAIAVSDSLKKDFIKEAKQRLKTYEIECKESDFYDFLEDLGIDISYNLPYVTLDNEPINEDIIWLWIEKQGLNPDNPTDGEAIVEKLYDLAINNQGVVSVAIETANHVIEAHRNDINSLYTLVLNLNK